MKSISASPPARVTCVLSLIPSAAGLALAGLLSLHSPKAQANVYATNIKLYDASNAPPAQATLATNAVQLPPGQPLRINYVLNESATAGVTIDVFAGTNVLRRMVFAGGSDGSARGLNSVVWDGLDSAGSNVVAGSYALRITAASFGYGDWTQTSDDSSSYDVYEPRGIAVNQNTNSPYYGRVFVGNASDGGDPTNPGYLVGIQKLNADGTGAEDGRYSDGGWPWAGDLFSPWKIEVSTDDQVYINDWSGNGLVLRFNQALAASSRLLVLRPDNWPPVGTSDGTPNGTTNYANFSGPFITGAGTNTQVWMADVSYNANTNIARSVGIRRFPVTSDGVIATNNLGLTIVATRGTSDLSLYPYDVAVDPLSRIYTIQNRVNAGDTTSRVLRFPAYNESGTPELTADWKIGSGDDAMRGAYGVAVNPAMSYVAVAFRGAGNGVSRVGGAARVFSAADGSPVASLTPAAYHDHTDVAWDNVGNLYACDNWDSKWRVYSPPGTNAATTVALQPLQVQNSATPPLLSAPGLLINPLQFTLIGQPYTAYVILVSPNLTDWARVATNQDSTAVRVITVPAQTPPVFVNAVPLQPADPMPIVTGLMTAPNQFQFTLEGQARTPYGILGSSDLSNWTALSTNTSAAATQVIAVPASGDYRFYRAVVLP